ncbi:putative glycoside hydrolase [Patescibacteria group bacterium]|nr:putative glycoside hydrolase [Patescibacteria group bacterium]
MQHPKLYFILALGFSAFCFLIVSWFWAGTLQAQEALTFEANDITPKASLAVRVMIKKQKPTKREVKGLYLTAYSAGSSKKVDQIIDLINSTELNAVVIDIKDYSGYVLYDSNLLWVNEFKTEQNRLGDVKEMIKKFHDNNIYVIARQTVFQDPVLAERKPEWAIKSKYGGLWRDHKGLAWVDPTEQSVWNYNLAIAKEAIKLGFDEINFDYVRFPSDGNMSLVVYTHGDKAKYDVMRVFFKFMSDSLADKPAWISIDMFGFVMERHDGMNIGQRLEDAVDYIDYICPMMYPSHYPAGHLGLSNPTDYPEIVFENGMKKGVSYFKDKRAEARPWVQAFNMGAVYDATKIRAQIDVIEKYTDGGWLLWNAANRYSSEGLKSD